MNGLGIRTGGVDDIGFVNSGGCYYMLGICNGFRKFRLTLVWKTVYKLAPANIQT